MPVQHIVWIKPNKATKTSTIDDILRQVKGLAHSISGVLAATTGKNSTERAMGCTYGAIVTLKDYAALEFYLVHPEHQQVGSLMRQHCSVLAMDYEHDG